MARMPAASFRLDNSYARELPGCYVAWPPALVASPQLLFVNRALAEACSAHNIRLAPPQREVRILSAASDSPTVPPAPAAVERHDS